MDDYRIRTLFLELLRLAYDHNNGYGNPCSWLLEQMVLYNDKLITRIMGDRSNESHEVRLNNSGLKMLWKVEDGKLYLTICGDQTDLYPEFVVRARLAIWHAGMSKYRP